MDLKNYDWKGLDDKGWKPPHGWIQWKGTDVCMDVYCKCGHLGHIDDEFAYFYRCPECGKVYEIDGHVKLFEIKNPDEYNITCVVTDS